MPHTDPTAEDTWCAARRAEVAACVERLALEHGRIGEWPAWHVMPYASLWAVESKHRPEWLGWWVICGDLPSDAIPAHDLPAPRGARVVLIGGTPLGHRHVVWNFVSSRMDRIRQAQDDWEAQRFERVPGETEFIPLPPRRP